MLQITVNGVAHELDLSDPDFLVTPDTSLAQFLRSRCNLTATKVSCDEGGCGACTVALTVFNPTLGKKVTRAVNACLAPLLSLNGLEVTTNDEASDGIHRKIQEQLAEDYGTQCGYCSSGMVMAMYSLLQENSNPTKLEIERMLDGNLCRCTGYRPILTAFRKFGVHEDGHQCDRVKCCKKLGDRELEIEDAARVMKPSKGSKSNSGSELLMRRLTSDSTHQHVQWIDCETEDTLRAEMCRHAGKKAMLVVAGTTQALDRVDYDVYLNVRNIPTFTSIQQDGNGVTFGAAVTVTDLSAYLSTCTAPTIGGERHFRQACAHLHRVASTLIRNRGSVVGNIVFTKNHQSEGNSFPSDAVVVLLGLGATVSVFNVEQSAELSMSLEQFMRSDHAAVYVRSVTIPWAAANEVFKSYKIAIRRTLDHAIVNGAMRAVVDPQTGRITGKPTVFVGGLFPAISRLPSVEDAMADVDLRSESDFHKICDVASHAVAKGLDPTPGREEYRRTVATNYVYKFLLALHGSVCDEGNARDAECWIEKTEESAGSQTFPDEVPGQLPVSKAISKFDGIHQTSGTATYTADIPSPAGCLFSAVVTTDRANVKIKAVETTAALLVPGFVRYFSAKDLNDSNNEARGLPLFVKEEVAFAGQVVGLVVAKSEEVARHCAQLIEAGIQYSSPSGAPVLTLKAAKKQKPVHELEPLDLEPEEEDSKKKLKAEISLSGTVQVNGQYHFFLENHSCLAQLVEGQLYIDAATQGVSNVQKAVSDVTGLPHTDVIVSTRRVGGGFGGKFEAPMNNAAMAGLAAKELKKPVRLNLSFKEAMRCFGGRPVYDFDYEIGVTKEGKIVSLKGTINVTTGATCGATLPVELEVAQKSINNAYYIPNMHIEGKAFKTNLPPTVPVRGPGWLQAIAMIEMVMTQVAHKLEMPLETLKQLNFIKAGDPAPDGLKVAGTDITKLWDKSYPKFVEMRREVDEFNRTHQFIKRGLSINPARFIVNWLGPYNAFVAVHADGSVTVSHGGIEIGQGINTKVQQCVAMAFGMSEDDAQKKIKIQPSVSYIASNPGNVTGGSVTSEMCCLATLNACHAIKERLKPYLTEAGNFVEAAGKALEAGEDLNACGLGKTGGESGSPRYNTWGCAVSMTEIDVLTGQFVLLKTDLIFDCGVSMNPYIDIGQVEGGFTYGLGWFTSEETKYDPKTGESNTAGTWEYKPPGAYDVPTELNVTLLENSNNTSGVLNSKAVAEPAVALACSVVHSLENAINASRAERGLGTFAVAELPLTVEQVQTNAGYTSAKHLVRSERLRQASPASPGVTG